MKLNILWCCLAITITSAISEAKSVPLYPKAIQGIWMTDDDEGQAQCRSYRSALQSDGVDASDFLVGAEVIRDTIWQSYAEYGEGDSYEITRVEKIGSHKWRFTATTYVDSVADAAGNQQARFRASLHGQKLLWVFETIGDQPVDSWDEHRYFRCSSLPKGFYAS